MLSIEFWVDLFRLGLGVTSPGACSASIGVSTPADAEASPSVAMPLACFELFVVVAMPDFARFYECVVELGSLKKKKWGYR